jgi:hypothetical protein
MNPHSDNELDFLFKEKLAAAKKEFVFLEEEWENMQDILSPQPRKKNRVIWLYRISVGMAASLLIWLSFQFANNATGNQLTRTAGYHSETARRPINQQPQYGLTSAHQTRSWDALLHRIAKQYHHRTRVQKPSPAAVYADSVDRDGSTSQTLSLAAESKGLSIDERLTGLLTMAPLSIDSAKSTIAVADNQKPLKTSTAIGSRFALAVLAAPDVNGVSSFSNGQTGLNLAVQLSLKLSRKLSISTGAAYAIKPYQTGLGNYRTNSPGWSAGLWTSNAKPNTVNANCYVLDIPLNINYQLYRKGKNSFAVGTGLSSYIMLKEDYRFTFPDPAKDGVDVAISNQNQHLLGVLNMNVNYQHQLNNKLGLIVQPYLKLPLTQIGFGQVGLQSAGVAVGFNWNIK